MIDQAQCVHHLRVGVRTVAADIDDPVRILRSELGQTRFELIGLDPLVADEHLAVAIEADDDRLFWLGQLGRPRFRQIERHADSQQWRSHHKDDEQHEHHVDHRGYVDLGERRVAVLAGFARWRQGQSHHQAPAGIRASRPPERPINPCIRPAKRPRSTVILLYATTAGIAAARPIAVANSASAIPGATTARLVLLAAAIPSKLRMIPQTVPNKPMKGAAEPSVARKGKRSSSRRNSAFRASRIARSMRSRRSPGVSASGGASAVLSAHPADSIAPAGSPAAARLSVTRSSRADCAPAARASWLRADRLAAPSRQSLSMITVQLHTD